MTAHRIADCEKANADQAFSEIVEVCCTAICRKHLMNKSELKLYCRIDNLTSIISEIEIMEYLQLTIFRDVKFSIEPFN